MEVYPCTLNRNETKVHMIYLTTFITFKAENVKSQLVD